MGDNIEQALPTGQARSIADLPELDVVYSAIDKLAFAQTTTELLDAVSDYPIRCGAVVGTLIYIDSNAESVPEWMEVVARWAPFEHPYGAVGSRVPISEAPASELLLSGSDTPFLIYDATESDLLTPTSRDTYRRAQLFGVAFLPLRIRSRWVGVLAFGWDKPYTFQEQDQRIYTVFARQIGLRVDTMQILEAERRHTDVLQTIARAGAAAAYSAEVDDLLQLVARPGSKPLCAGPCAHLPARQVRRKAGAGGGHGRCWTAAEAVWPLHSAELGPLVGGAGRTYPAGYHC